MFAIAFDMTVAEVREHHPKGYQRPIVTSARRLDDVGFERIQGSV